MGSERERRRAARWLAVVVGLCHTADHASLIAVQLFLEADGADPLLIGLNVTLWGLGGVIGGFLWGGISDRLRTAALLALTFLGGALSEPQNRFRKKIAAI